MVKKGVVFLILVLLTVVGFASTVNAEADYEEFYTDAVDDVVYYSNKQPVDDPNVDIIEMGSTEAGNNIEITVRVVGVPDTEAHSIMVNCMADGVGYRWSYVKESAAGGKTDDIYSMNYVDYTIEGGNLTFIIPKTQMLVEHEFVIINGTAEYQAFTPNGTIWYYDFIEGGTSSYTPGGEDDDDDDQDDDDDIDDEAEGTKLGPFKTKDGKPIDGGEAIVGPGGTRTVYQAVTDSEGYAAFSEKIPQGNYSLKVQVEGVPVIESELAISSTDDVTYDGDPQPSLSEKTYAEIYDVQDDDDVEPPEEEEEDSPGFEFSLVALGVLCAFLLFRKYRK